MNQRKQRLFLLQISGRLSTRSLSAGFKIRYKPKLQSDKCGYAKARNLPGKAIAREGDGAIVCKGSSLMAQQRDLKNGGKQNG